MLAIRIESFGTAIHGFSVLFCTRGISFSHLLVSTLYSAASTPCSTSPSYISVDLCTCHWITGLCSCKHLFVEIIHLNCMWFMLFLVVLALLINCLLISADYDWYSVFPLWVLWWSASCFYGLDSCLVVWAIYSY